MFGSPGFLFAGLATQNIESELQALATLSTSKSEPQRRAQKRCARTVSAVSRKRKGLRKGARRVRRRRSARC